MVSLDKNRLQVADEILEIENPGEFRWINIIEKAEKKLKLSSNDSVIKINLVKTTKENLYFNIVFIKELKSYLNNPFKPGNKLPMSGSNKITCLIIPTGIGAKFGGYAGDANPIAKILSMESKHLLTHPNVVNGAVLSDLPSNLIYLEGYLLDQFLLGQINIVPRKENKIGIIFDRAISEERLRYELNVLNALRAFYGCEIIGWTVLKKPLNCMPQVNDFGFSSGKIENVEVLIECALHLKNKGATAIAICASIPDLDLNKNYISGSGIDPIGGIESMISRIVSATTGLPSAHAPALLSDERINYAAISPLSASEYIAQTFLPSVISGLRYAPQVVPYDLESASFSKSNADIKKVLVPYNAFGSPGVFHLCENLSK